MIHDALVHAAGRGARPCPSLLLRKTKPLKSLGVPGGSASRGELPGEAEGAHPRPGAHTAGRAAAAAQVCPPSRGEQTERGAAQHVTHRHPLPAGSHSDGAGAGPTGAPSPNPPPPYLPSRGGPPPSAPAPTEKEKRRHSPVPGKAPTQAGPLCPQHRLNLRPAVVGVKWRPEARRRQRPTAPRERR